MEEALGNTSPIFFFLQDVIQAVKVVASCARPRAGSVTQVPEICFCGYTLSSGLAVLAGDKVGYMAGRSLCLSPQDLDVLAVEEQKPMERRRAPSMCLSQGLLLFWQCIPFCIEEFPIMFILLNILRFRILESNQVVRTVFNRLSR